MTRTDTNGGLSFVMAEFLFTSILDLEEMRAALTAAGARPWFVRSGDADYLCTPAHGVMETDERLRIEPLPDRERSYRLSLWCAASADDLDRARDAAWGEVFPHVKAREVDEQPPDLALGRAGREDTAFGFHSPLSLADMQTRFVEVTDSEWTICSGDAPALHAARAGGDLLQDVRWRVTARDGGFALEVHYRGNPHEEQEWRQACATVHDELLPAVGAANVAELDEHESRIERVSIHKAWAITSGLTLEQIRAGLAEAGGGVWQMRDSSWYGDYLSSITSAPYDEVTKLRVFEEEQRFVFDVRFRSEHPAGVTHWQQSERRIAEQLMKAFEARDVRETEGYD